MPTVGYAVLQIIPSVRGISDELKAQLVGPAADSGQQAGESAGGGFKEAFQGALAAIGITEVASKIGEQFTEAFNQAMEQSNALSTLSNQLGSTGKDAANQGAAVGKLFAQGVTENFEQGAEAVRSIVSGGLVPPGASIKQINSIGARFTDVANTFGTDMSIQSQAVSAILKNKMAPDATSALDLITVGFQKLGPNAEDLLDTFQEYPVQLRKLGLDAKTSMGLFQQGLQGGARDTDIVADSLKEFSIRAIDMSAGSQTAYKAIGLSAKGMSLQISKGGKGATAGLQTVLDKLRGMKDPVARNAAAVGLFGTQAEELGTALFKLDPGKATKTFADVGGAADKLGKGLRSGPSYEIEIFKRTLQQGLVTFIGGKVLPILSKWGSIFNSAVLPPLAKVGGVLSDLFLPTLGVLGSALSGTINWFKEWGIWLTPLAIAIAGVTLALNASAIATGIVTAVFEIYRIAVVLGTAVTEGYAGAMAFLNSVMALNPFVLVAIALVALVALIVIAWKNSDTFRAIVMAAWAGIQTAVSYAWNSILKPAFAGFMVGLHAVGDAALWLWNNAISPAFSFISTAARILATIITIVVGGPIYLAFLLIGTTAMWLWNSVLSPVIGWIVQGFKLWWAAVQIYFGLFMTGVRALGAVAVWLWNNAISPVIGWIVAGFKLWWAGVTVVFGYFKAGVRALGAVAMWLWKNSIKPAFDGIVTVISWFWNQSIKPLFAFFMAGVHKVGDVATWLWTNSIKPAFNNIADKATWLWNNALKPAFEFMKKGVKAAGDSFGKAKDFIAKAWNQVQDIAKKPIRFIIGTVYNKGLVPVWNKVAGAFGAPKLSTMSLDGFARGGVLPGYTPGRDPHKFYSPTGGGLELSGGEAIMRPEFTRAVGPGLVNSLNRIARTRGSSGIKAALAPALGGNPRTPTQRFSAGGIFSWIGKKAAGAGSAAWNGVKKTASWLKDSMEASARAGVKAVVNPLLKVFPGADTNFGKMLRSVPSKMIDSLFGYSKTADKKGAGGLGGPRVQAALSWARSQAGNAYQWGGGGPLYDCSGFMSAIESVLRGEKPHRRWSTFAFQGATAPAGWEQNATSPFRIGVTNNGVGHTAGTLGGVNVEDRGGDGVVVGSRARGYNNAMFGSRYGFVPAKKFDRGGWLLPGATATVNETGQPEAILTGPQWHAMAAQAAAAKVAVAASAKAGGSTSGMGQSGLEGLSLQVFVGSEEISQLARAEVRKANGELIAVLNAGGGN
jgi:hypothetical protein